MVKLSRYLISGENQYVLLLRDFLSLSKFSMSRRDKTFFSFIAKSKPKTYVSEPFEPTNHQVIPRPSIIKPTAEKSFNTTFTRHSLKCYETLPSSDEEYDNINRAVNYFEDFDDSVIDKNYCPDFIISDSDSNSPIRIKKIYMNIKRLDVKRLNVRRLIVKRLNMRRLNVGRLIVRRLNLGRLNERKLNVRRFNVRRLNVKIVK